MKFKCDTAGNCYSTMPKEYFENLKALGFKFDEHKCKISDGNSVIVEIKSLKDFVAFVQKMGPVIVSPTEDTISVEIYDDTVE